MNNNEKTSCVTKYNQLLGQLQIMIKQQIPSMKGRDQKMMQQTLDQFSQISGQMTSMYESLISRNTYRAMGLQATNTLLMHEARNGRLLGSPAANTKPRNVVHATVGGNDSAAPQSSNVVNVPKSSAVKSSTQPASSSSSSKPLFTFSNNLKIKSRPSSQKPKKPRKLHFKSIHNNNQKPQPSVTRKKLKTPPKFTTNISAPKLSVGLGTQTKPKPQPQSQQAQKQETASIKQPNLNSGLVNDRDSSRKTVSAQKAASRYPKTRKTGVRRLFKSLHHPLRSFHNTLIKHHRK